MNSRVARIGGIVLALLAALALLVAAVLLLTRGDDTAPVVIMAPEATAAPARAETDIRVQVSGAVMAPGVYAMTESDRVMDAISAAGGVHPDAELSGINLARRVQDEAHYRVPFTGESDPAPTTTGEEIPLQGSASPAPLVDLNSATSRELETLPGIGPAMAGRIIAHREANGPFASIDDVENVPGIGPKTLESIRAMVTVSGNR